MGGARRLLSRSSPQNAAERSVGPFLGVLREAGDPNPDDQHEDRPDDDPQADEGILAQTVRMSALSSLEDIGRNCWRVEDRIKECVRLTTV